MNVALIQTDNRPYLYYVQLTQQVNKKQCNKLGITYEFIDSSSYSFTYMQFAKLYVVREFLKRSTADLVILLDTDAWIHNPLSLSELLYELHDSNHHGAFSRDLYLPNNTYINSGSFIIKNNVFVRSMYDSVLMRFEADRMTHTDKELVGMHGGWCDQYYLSNYVYENRRHFTIFAPSILNTPDGMVLRHNWYKNKKMYEDCGAILREEQEDASWDRQYDKMDFPNKRA